MSPEEGSTLAYVTALVASALDDADNPAVPTSSVARKALRIARLRNDWTAVLMLQIELRPPGDHDARQRVSDEVRPHFTSAQLDVIWRKTTESYIAGRTISDDQILGQSLPEAEAAINGLREQIAHMPSAGHGADFHRETLQRAELVFAASQREQILARVRQRVADYLSQTERQIVLGRLSADVWERNRQFVDERLTLIAPEALAQFAAAYRRHSEGDPEARSHALTSCRRVLKTLADALYPATGAAVEGVDGVTRKMTEDRFVMRLCQFAADSTRGSGARDLLVSQVSDLGRRLDALNTLASKGVHAIVSQAEVDQCLIQTYLTAGDLLRIAVGTSAALAPTPT